MAGLTTAAADAVLKEDYRPAIREQLNNANVLLAYVMRNTEDVEGRRAILSLHVARNSGVGARAEMQVLPDPGNQGYVEERVPMHFNYGRIQVSGPAIKAMKSDSGSFTRAIKSETTGLTTDIKRDFNRQLWGTGDGVIATTGATAGSNTVVLNAATRLSQQGQLEVGMKVDIGTVASPTSVATGRFITAVDITNKTVTVDGAAVTTTDGVHFIFRNGAGGAGSNQKELTGVQKIVSDSGVLFNVDPATAPSWKSTVSTNSSDRSISENLWERAIMDAAIFGGGDANLIITSPGVFRAYSELLISNKRFNDTRDLKGGFKGLSIAAGGADKAITWDRDCPSGTAFGLATDHLTLFQESDWEWMNDDGAVLNRVPNVDAYEATLYKYAELTTDQRNAHWKIDKLSES